MEQRDWIGVEQSANVNTIY